MSRKLRLKINSFLRYTPLLLVVLTLTACGPPPPPTPTPTPQPSPTATGIPPTATRTPTPTHTGTPTATPTETPQPTFISTPGPRPTVVAQTGDNTAREQYDQAQARWRAQNVLLYEIAVSHASFSPWAGKWTLRVSGDQIDVLSYSNFGGTPTTPFSLVQGDALKFLTVEGQFATIERRLSTEQPVAPENLLDYFVTFDPTLGYPASIEIKTKPNVPVGDLGSSTSVESLKIIKRALPLAPLPNSPVP